MADATLTAQLDAMRTEVASKAATLPTHEEFLARVIRTKQQHNT